MENERLRITLDKTDRIYYAGQSIKGVITLNLTKRTKIRAIKVQISGKGKCKWMEILRKNAQYSNESSRSLFYSSKEIYCHCENSLPEFEPRGIELNVGEHNFDFTMPLDMILPSSFKGSYGSIKYKLRILIQRPWTFDERHKIPITIIKRHLLPNCRINTIQPLRKEITKTISIFGSRPITLVALLPKDFAISGGTLSICATVTNNSATNVEKLRFTVFQHIMYHSHVPLRIEKLDMASIATKETGGVQKKSERSFAHELLIPATAPPTDVNNSDIIHITYELRVEAVFRGLFKNIVLHLPFTLYSADPDNMIIPNNNRASVLRETGSVFETSSVGMPVYPSMNSSIGSPSRSSQISESGSLYSSTSDSSATTLSPATAGAGECSYRSSGSSNFNNSSAADLHRNLYICPGDLTPPFDESPQDRSLHGLPQYIDHLIGAWANIDPLDYTEEELPSFSSASSNSRPTSSALSLNRDQPPGVDELPPSYEELFGRVPKL